MSEHLEKDTVVTTSQPAGDKEDNHDIQELAQQLCAESPEEQQKAISFLAANQYKSTYRETLISLARAVYEEKGLEGAQTLLRALNQHRDVVGLQHNLLQLRCLNTWLHMEMEEEDVQALEEEFKLLKAFDTWLKQGLKQLEKDNYALHYTLLGSFPQLGYVLLQSGVISFYTKALKHKNAELRKAAVEALGETLKAAPDKAVEIISILLKGCGNEYFEVRQAAGEALGEALKAIPDKAVEIISILLKGCENEYFEVRQAAVEALGKVAKAVPDQTLIIPSLLAACMGTSRDVRKAAVEALGAVAKAAPDKAEEIIPRLLRSLDMDNRSVRKAAVEALGAVVKAAPDKAEEIIPRLLKALKDPDEDVRKAAVYVIIFATNNALLAPNLLKALEDENDLISYSTTKTLGAKLKANPYRAFEIIPVLLKALRDESSWSVQKAALEALREATKGIADKADKIIPILLKALGDESSCSIRKAVLETLKEVAKAAPDKAEEIIPRLLKALGDKNSPSVRKAAIEALKEVAKIVPSKAEEIIPRLLKALKDPDEDVCKAAEESLEAYPTKTLINAYLTSTTCKKLSPFIKEKLYRETLLIGPLEDGEYTLTLYTDTGKAYTWQASKKLRIAALKRLCNPPALQVQTKKSIKKHLSLRHKHLTANINTLGKVMSQRFGKKTNETQIDTSQELDLSSFTQADSALKESIQVGAIGEPTIPPESPPKTKKTLLEKVIAELKGEATYGLIKNRRIDLSRQLITDANLEALAQALKATKRQVSLLTLKDNTISDSGAEYLIALLKAKTGIIGVDLRGNLIKKQELTKIDKQLVKNLGPLLDRIRTNQLKEDDTTTQGVLDLSHYSLSPRALKKLSKALAANTTLTTVDLRGNTIDDEGANYLRELLEKNTHLTKLYLDEEAIVAKTTTQDIHRCLERNQRLFILECIRKTPQMETDLISDGVLDLSRPLTLLGAKQDPSTPLTLLEIEQLTQILAKKTTLSLPEVKKVSQILKAHPSLSGLNLANAKMNDNGAVALAKGLQGNKTLSKLDLPYNDIEATGMAALAKALHKQTVIHLNLQGNTIGTEGIEALADEFLQDNTTLQVLNLSNSDIGDEGMRALRSVLIKDKTGLRELTLRYSQIRETGARHLNVILSRNIPLKTLDLRGNKLGDAGVTALVRDLGKNDTLRSLDLSYNKIGNTGAAQLRDMLKENKTLTEVKLAGNPIGKDILKTINDYLERNRREELLELLKNNKPHALVSKDGVLDLSNIPLSGAYISKLSNALKNNTTVKTLKLSHTGIGKPEMIALAAMLQENTTIKTLDLSYNGIKAEGIESLSGVLENSTLEALNLEGNLIEAKGAKLLQNSLVNNTNLKALNVKRNNLTNSGAKRMAVVLQLQAAKGEPTLEELNLEDNSITQLKTQRGAIKDPVGEALNSAIGRNTALKRITLQGNDISLGCLARIGTSLQRNNGTVPPAPRHNSTTPASAIGTIMAPDENFDALLGRIKTRTLTAKDQDQSGTLNLSNYTLTFEKINRLNEALKSNQEITGLNLGQTPITDLEVYALSRLVAQNDQLIRVSYTNTAVEHNILIQDIDNSLNRNRVAWNLEQLATGNPRGNIRLSVAGILSLNRKLNAREIAGLGAVIAKHGTLTGVKLQNAKLTNEQIKGLTKKVKERIQSGKSPLKSLDLRDNKLTHSAISAVTGLLKANKGTLDTLDLSKNPIRGKGVEMLTKALKKHKIKLKVLKLEATEISSVNSNALKSLLTHKTLEEFSLSRNKLGDQATINISKVLSDPHLTSQLHALDLSHNQIGESGAEALRDMLRTNRTLTELNLKGNPGIPSHIRDEIEGYLDRNRRDKLVEALKENKSHAFVSNDGVLDLSDIALGGAYISKLSDALKTNTTVRTLKLRNTGIGAAEMIALAALLKENTTIEKLDLSWNTIDAKAMHHFCEALKGSRLQELNLEGNQIGSQGAKPLQDSLISNKTLKVLNIKGNNLGNRGAQRMAVALQLQAAKGEPTLEELNLEDDSIGDQGGQALNTALNGNSVLKTLHLEDNPISPGTLGKITTSLQRNKRRTSQDARSNTTTPNGVDSDFDALLERIRTRTLTDKDQDQTSTLDLRGYTLTFAKIELLTEALKSNQEITGLNLGNTPITHLEAHALGNLVAQNDKLIEVSYNKENIQHNILIRDIEGGIRYNTELHKLRNLGSSASNAQQAREIEDHKLNFRNLFLSHSYLTAINDILVVNPTLEALHLTNTNIKDASLLTLQQGIEESQGLKTLNLQGNSITHRGLTTLVGALSNRKLRNLNLGNNGIDATNEDTLKRLLNHKTIEVLNLGGNQLGNKGAVAVSVGLQFNTILHTLDLSNNAIGDTGIKALAIELTDANTTVRKLNLSSNQISNAGAEHLRAMLEKTKTLTELNLKGNPGIPSHILGEIEGYIARNRRLALLQDLKANTPNPMVSKEGVLDLRGITLSEAYISELSKALKNNTTVKELNLSRTKIKDKQVKDVAKALEGNKTLEVLHLEQNNIKADGAKALATMLKKNGALKKLVLEDNLIENKGIAYLSEALEENNTLEELNVNNNNITAAGIKPLERCLIKNKGLKTLDLSYNPISNQGAIRLALVLLLQSKKRRAALETLNLKYCSIGNLGAQILKRILGETTAVKTLTLKDNPIDAKHIHEINRQLQRNKNSSKSKKISSLSDVTDTTQEEGIAASLYPTVNGKDTDTRDNAFNHLDDFGYEYQASDMGLIQSGGYLKGFSVIFSDAENLGRPISQENALTRLDQMLTEATGGRPSLCIYNKGRNHWVSVIIADVDGQKVVLYKDSMGGDIDPDLRGSLKARGIRPENIKVNRNAEQTGDYSHCGIMALENLSRMTGGLLTNSASFVEGFEEEKTIFCPLEGTEEIKGAKALRGSNYDELYFKGVVAQMQKEKQTPSTAAGVIEYLYDTLNLAHNPSKEVQDRFVTLVDEALASDVLTAHRAKAGDTTVIDEDFVRTTLKALIEGPRNVAQGEVTNPGDVSMEAFTKVQNPVSTGLKPDIESAVDQKLEGIYSSLFNYPTLRKLDEENRTILQKGLKTVVLAAASRDTKFREAFLKSNSNTLGGHLKDAIKAEIKGPVTLLTIDEKFMKAVVQNLSKRLVAQPLRNSQRKRPSSAQLSMV